MIVSCGEALVDLSPMDCEGVDAFAPRVGGSPLNVAVGLARLGVTTAFFGRVSTDAFGSRIVDHLAENGVDLRFVRRGPEPTTLAIVDARAGREPGFSFHGEGAADRMLRPADLPASFGPEVRALHFGSISLVLEPAASTLEACMRREQTRRVLTLDPNVRPSLIVDRAVYLRRLETWVGLVDVVRASRADVTWLYPDLVPEAILDRWMGLGAGVAVITTGASGARAVGLAGTARVPGRRVRVVDTVGAGDAFMAGLLAWLDRHGRLERSRLLALEVDSLQAALAAGIDAAALTCARQGADPPWAFELGIPTDPPQATPAR